MLLPDLLISRLNCCCRDTKMQRYGTFSSIVSLIWKIALPSTTTRSTTQSMLLLFFRTFTQSLELLTWLWSQRYGCFIIILIFILPISNNVTRKQRMSTTSKHTPTSQNSTKISSFLCRDALNSDFKIQLSLSMQLLPKSFTPPGKARKLRSWLIEKRIWRHWPVMVAAMWGSCCRFRSFRWREDTTDTRFRIALTYPAVPYHLQTLVSEWLIPVRLKGRDLPM